MAAAAGGAWWHAASLLKLVATIISYSSGNAGGIFAPSLFIGAMAGGAVGTIVHRVAPFPTGDPGAYALVGMGALFAGIIRAPMTSVFMIFEITQDYQILVPLMVANLLSFAISKRYQPMTIYHALLHQDDIHLPSVAARAVRPAWTAAAMMRTDAAWMPPDPATSPVEEPFVHVHPDHPFDIVLERFAQSSGLLPVVDREQARRVVGVITLEDVTRFLERRRTERRDA